MTNGIPEIYDDALCNQLINWFTPDREQAGGLSGRSCTDHIVTLCLLMLYALSKIVKLGSTMMTSLLGVRQGSPTSCFLFTL